MIKISHNGYFGAKDNIEDAFENNFARKWWLETMRKFEKKKLK